MKKAHLLIILIPILVMVGWIAKHRLKNVTSELALEVRGYDPRDLLSGHYIQYQVVYSDEDPCKNTPRENSYDLSMCVCFSNAPSTPARAISSGSCTTTSCEVFIKGYCNNGRFEAGIERFFLSETAAKELLVLPPKSHIKVKLGRDGSARVESLWPAGQELKSYKAEKRR